MTNAVKKPGNSAQKTPIEEACERAMGLQIAGKLDFAEPIYRGILKQEPKHAGANYCLGMLLVQKRRAADACPLLLAAVESQPQVADYWLGFLEALLLSGDLKQAAEVLALARTHGLAGEATENFAQRLASARPQATPHPAPIVSPAPKQRSAGDNRRRAQAIQRQEAAVMALVEKNQFREALPLAREMTERFPECGSGWKMLGAMLWSVGDEPAAIEAMQTAARLLPDDAETHKNLAAAVNKYQRLDDAEKSLLQALKANPRYSPAHLVLGHNYQLQGRYAEARRSLEQAIAYHPHGVLEGLTSAHSLLLFVLNNDPAADADTLFAESRKVGEHLKRTQRAAARPRARNKDPERTLQVGFVSADLYNHSVARFLEPLLHAWQDRKSLCTTLYYVNHVQDRVSERLRGYASRWHQVQGLTNTQLEQHIVDDGIDVLIDLSGHTAMHRLEVFARKPAPVQISWLGYPSTTGLDCMDYYLADKHFLPPGEFERYFTEKLVYLPAAWSFEPVHYAPDVNSLPALENGYVTFGSFNRLAKINESSVKLWAQLMHAVPGSRLLVAGVPLDVAPRRLGAWFAAEGIAAERVSYHAYTGQEAIFALHQKVDLALEPMPYSGCTTSNHALWLGVPSLTCIGTTPASRLSAANLGQLGLHEFIAASPEDFVAKGLRWTGDLTALSQLRASLRERWRRSPARDGALVAAGMELALRRAWRRWCDGLPAESFEVTFEDARSIAAR